jgi:hypothetical protein
MQWAIAPRISAFVPATEFLHQDGALNAIYARIRQWNLTAGNRAAES